jgi:hypothetical protein
MISYPREFDDSGFHLRLKLRCHDGRRELKIGVLQQVPSLTLLVEKFRLIQIWRC